jgi:hypothetical protein
MSSSAEQAFPTMIIPQGTEIRINTNGQLSIKTPGNLVIQNSGNYSELESTNGSIRIEDNVSVEAVTVRAAQACFIQGTLTAWRVTAKKIALEDRAKAYIMMQESETLEVSRNARLVGNFANEREIYLLLGKFTAQLRELPGSVDLHQGQGAIGRSPVQTLPGTSGVSARPELPGPLAESLSLLEAEMRKGGLDAKSGEAMRELVFALRERNVQRVGLVYREAFSELTAPSDPLRRAYELLASHFAAQR